MKSFFLGRTATACTFELCSSPGQHFPCNKGIRLRWVRKNGVRFQIVPHIRFLDNEDDPTGRTWECKGIYLGHDQKRIRPFYDRNKNIAGHHQVKFLKKKKKKIYLTSRWIRWTEFSVNFYTNLSFFLLLQSYVHSVCKVYMWYGKTTCLAKMFS